MEKHREAHTTESVHDTQTARAGSPGKLEDWLYYNGLSKNNYAGLTYVGYEAGGPSPYVVGQMANRLGCSAEEIALCTSARIPEEDREAFRQAKAAQGTPPSEFCVNYRVLDGKGGYVHLTNRAIPFRDPEGRDGYIYFVTDMSHEHRLMEQLRWNMEEKMRENEQVFRIVAQHSNRTICHYDVAARRVTLRDEGDGEDVLLPYLQKAAAAVGTKEEGLRGLHGAKALEEMFASIHAGQPSGDAHLYIRLPDGRRRWYQVKYSCLFQAGKPVSALLSFKDATDRHEQELSHLRLLQSDEHKRKTQLGYMEADLSADLVELQTGFALWGGESYEGLPYSAFVHGYRLGLSEEDSRAANLAYSRETLLAQYTQGVRNLENIWHVERADGTRWIHVHMELAQDPFTGHVKLFIGMTDITREHEERLAVKQRADYDAMTGLLRRDVGEMRIRTLLGQSEYGGILIVLDLDDLKGINDTLGHAQGDRAIRGIAATLKAHFRRDDILVRTGGDEFMVFLPGAGQSVSSVSLSMMALLRKLASLSIGENDERYIHCSAGCAVETPGRDSFEELYQRADLALYHVKRKGKNNFAFFEPGMLQENYEFRMKQAVPRARKNLEEADLYELYKSLSKYFQYIAAFDLSNDLFRMVAEGADAGMIPQSGSIDILWRSMQESVHPEDRERLFGLLSRKGLLLAYESGKRGVSCRFRCREKEPRPYFSVNLSVDFYRKENGDTCAFAFFRREQEGGDVEMLRLQKILEFSVVAGFEYICLIDVRDRSYSVYSSDEKNSHNVPEHADFDMVTEHIRNTQIVPEERESYYQNAILDTVLAHMTPATGSYSYRYTMLDGIMREAVFTWYEQSRRELLMTVRKLG